MVKRKLGISLVAFFISTGIGHTALTEKQKEVVNSPLEKPMINVMEKVDGAKSPKEAQDALCKSHSGLFRGAKMGKGGTPVYCKHHELLIVTVVSCGGISDFNTSKCAKNAQKKGITQQYAKDAVKSSILGSIAGKRIVKGPTGVALAERQGVSPVYRLICLGNSEFQAKLPGTLKEFVSLCKTDKPAANQQLQGLVQKGVVEPSGPVGVPAPTVTEKTYRAEVKVQPYSRDVKKKVGTGTHRANVPHQPIIQGALRDLEDPRSKIESEPWIQKRYSMRDLEPSQQGLQAAPKKGVSGHQLSAPPQLSEHPKEPGSHLHAFKFQSTPSSRAGMGGSSSQPQSGAAGVENLPSASVPIPVPTKNTIIRNLRNRGHHNVGKMEQRGDEIVVEADNQQFHFDLSGRLKPSSFE